MAPLECVANVSEGRDPGLLGDLATACGDVLLDVHTDPHHNRAVFTMAGPSAAVESAARSLASLAVERIDIRTHTGAHPRLGAIDVVPFVPLPGGLPAPDADLGPATIVRDRFARWAGRALDLPCFLYGPLDGLIQSLPAIRRAAFAGLLPDTGPRRPHPTAGATAVGARGVLVAYNLWLDAPAAGTARAVAAAIRGPAVRALAFELGEDVQISCNLVEPFTVGPAAVYDEVATLLEPTGCRIVRAELVGLLPAAVLEAVPSRRWPELDLDWTSTIEARMEEGSVRTR